MRDTKNTTLVVLLLGLSIVPLGAVAVRAQQLMNDKDLGADSAETAQMAQIPALDSNGSWIFRKQVNEVTVMFTATHKGKFVADLQRDDVQVRDDKKPPAEILDFRNEEDLPLRMGLLIDTSGSVGERFHFEQQAGGEFANQVIDPNHDQAFVIGFSHRPHMVQDFTGDTGRVAQAMYKLHDDQGDTALFDAVAYACRRLASTPERQPVARVLVLVSDGDDNASDVVLKEAVQIAQADEVTIYTISTNPRGLNLIGDDALEKLAQESGGRALFPGNLKQVGKAFAKIGEELRSRYAVSYRPAEFKPDGRFRHIRIVARKFGKKLHVHARRGYYARPALADAGSAPQHP